MTDRVITSAIHWKDYLDAANIERDIDSVCKNCKKEQIRKNGKITITCSGMLSVDDVLSKEEVAMLPLDEVEMLEKEVNRYKWAKDTFVKDDGRALIGDRFYQEMMIRCSAKRKVLRCGRRVGKSFSMAVMITEALLRNEDYRILVVTPFEVQAEEIFNLVKQLLNNVKGIAVSDIIERSVSSPTHFIKLKNGSRVRGFTTGSSGAGSVRGQGADEIFIDEIDYMTEKDFNSIMAILADAPDTKLTVASTPDGEKMLYKLSRTVTYKEFHFPTFVLPHYNDELDRDLRDTTDDIGYVQEFMAEFGSSRSSVFQKIFIKRALNLATKIYIEDVMEDRKRYALALGCDWNHENIGTKICISAMDRRTHIISPVVFESVSKEGWTQTSAMDKIIELNRLYVPEHIYVDEGFGYAQIEMLKKFAISKYGKTELSDPDLKLANIIGVNFSSSVKIRDPKTNEEKNRFIKQYMVENAVSFFEEGLISLDLERDKTLEDELTGYIEKSRTPSGRIVYAASNPKIGDHNLDAFMLSLYALHMEYSDLFRDKGMPAVAVVLSGPEKIEVQSRSSTLTGNKDLAYFSEPVKRLHYRTTSFEGETQRPYRGGRTKSLVSNRWTFS